nr:LysR family transcriptional regulator [Chelativorans xinjiangense]
MRHGSITAAAQALNVSQPAVSRLIADLERSVGFRLFLRQGGKSEPTTEAREFIQEVERMFYGLDRLGHGGIFDARRHHPALHHSYRLWRFRQRLHRRAVPWRGGTGSDDRPVHDGLHVSSRHPARLPGQPLPGRSDGWKHRCTRGRAAAHPGPGAWRHCRRLFHAHGRVHRRGRLGAVPDAGDLSRHPPCAPCRASSRMPSSTSRCRSSPWPAPASSAG